MSYSILNNSEEEDGYYFGVSDNELITAALLTYNYQSSYELQIEVMDSGSKTYIEWIEITVLQVDSDGDSVSDHEDAFPTDNRYSYYELSVNSEGTIETETYYDASYEEVLLVTTTYGSDGSIEEVVTEETENGVTTITYETGTER